MEYMRIKHPGVIFFIVSMVFTFWLTLWFYDTNLPRHVAGSIYFFCVSMVFWWNTYFHTRWIEGLFEKHPK
jgi:hypothetical protein